MRIGKRSDRRSDEFGTKRFLRYLDRYVSEAPGLGMIYPDLATDAWLDAERFPIAAALETAFEPILGEATGLGDTNFHPESERSIERDGAWDVFMLYERGRRRAENCARVAQTMRVLDAFETMKTFTGLTYFSRMKPHTHIAAHRGPTNFRVRLHLPLVVPAGDCAMRVANETRRWETGRCTVFDDRREHEAWNHTSEARLVFVADLWHPDLTKKEIRMLTAFHGRILAQTDNLTRYWAENDRAQKTLPRQE